MTKLISAYPCVGKTTLYRSDRERYMDLEFRETASTKGMNSECKKRMYAHYADIISEMLLTGTYKYIFITDNELLLKELAKRKIPFTYVVPDPDDAAYRKQHYQRTIDRNDIVWYDNIIAPRNKKLHRMIQWINDRLGMDIYFLNTEKPFLKDIIDDIR